MDLPPSCRSPLSGHIQNQPVIMPDIRLSPGQDEMLVISEAELAKIEGSAEQFEQQLGTRSRPVTVRDVPEEGDREAPILIPDENGYLPGFGWLADIEEQEARPALEPPPPELPSPVVVEDAPSLEDFDIKVESVEHDGYVYRAGRHEAAELFDGSFLRIQSIAERPWPQGGSEIYLRGPRFRRNKSYWGLLPPKVNEVAMFETCGQVVVSNIVRPRKLIMTNAEFPEHRELRGTKEYAHDHSLLVCRWKISLPCDKLDRRYHWGVIERLRADEADKRFRVDNHVSRNIWRNRPYLGDERYHREEEDMLEKEPVHSTYSADGYHPVQPHGIAFLQQTIDDGAPRPSSFTQPSAQGSVGIVYEDWQSATETPPSSPRRVSAPDIFSQGPSAYSEQPYRRSYSQAPTGRAWDLITRKAPATNPSVMNPPQKRRRSVDSSLETPRKRPLTKKPWTDPLPNGRYAESGFMKDKTPLQRPDFEKSGKMYTFGDAFCGGGGMSSGARSAGFFNKWGFDVNPQAVATYRKNFPKTTIYQAFVDEFLKLQLDDRRVDALHLSPPCQPHSPAHTIAGRDDDANEASGLCISECLSASKPRFVTLEQTFGLVYRPNWFTAMIMQFTTMGFSVSWRVLRCIQYGVPQVRKRLVLLGSCPGERLPRFPRPQYADYPTKPGSTLKPPRTLADAIRDIPPDATNHDPYHPRWRFPNGGIRVSKADWNKPFTRTILAGGGDYDVHPEGWRRFTTREIAAVQTFPHTHEFLGSQSHRRRQVGNAVPPMLAEALLREVKKVLEESDRAELERQLNEPLVVPVFENQDFQDADEDDALVLVRECRRDTPLAPYPLRASVVSERRTAEDERDVVVLEVRPVQPPVLQGPIIPSSLLPEQVDTALRRDETPIIRQQKLENVIFINQPEDAITTGENCINPIVIDDDDDGEEEESINVGNSTLSDELTVVGGRANVENSALSGGLIVIEDDEERVNIGESNALGDELIVIDDEECIGVGEGNEGVGFVIVLDD